MLTWCNNSPSLYSSKYDGAAADALTASHNLYLLPPKYGDWTLYGNE